MESFTYASVSGPSHELRTALETVTNELSGATTTYAYSTTEIGFAVDGGDGAGSFPGTLVESITHPEESMSIRLLRADAGGFRVLMAHADDLGAVDQQTDLPIQNSYHQDTIVCEALTVEICHDS